jgi:hypothetical protein
MLNVVILTNPCIALQADICINAFDVYCQELSVSLDELNTSRRVPGRVIRKDSRTKTKLGETIETTTNLEFGMLAFEG